MEQIAEASRRPLARITGVVYLLYFLTAMTGELLIRGNLVAGNSAATATNLLAHERLFQASMAVGLVATGLYIAVTVLFYTLFEPVNRTMCLLAAFFSMVGCAIQAVGSLFRVAPFAILEGGSYLS